MQALVYTDTQTLIYREEKEPKLVDGESIIKVSASGICGSDMHAYHGKDNRRIPPLILGHEISGVIDKGKETGKKVVLNPLITCGKCDHCINWTISRCLDSQKSTPFFAEYSITPSQNAVQIPSNLDIEIACMTEPASCLLYTSDAADEG